MGHELIGACRPGVAERFLARGRAVAAERSHRRRAKILRQDPADAVLEHVERAGDGIGRDRHAGGQRLDHHVAERVGAAGEDEDIGRAIERRQLVAGLAARGTPHRDSGAARFGAGRAVADDDLGAGHIELEEGARRSFRPRRGRHRADAGRGRSRTRLRRSGLNSDGIDAARPEADVARTRGAASSVAHRAVWRPASPPPASWNQRRQPIESIRSGSASRAATYSGKRVW